MLDIIRKEIRNLPTQELKIHRTREFLQLLILKILNDTGYFKYLAFVGGTALRILYDLKRFSEDLDFSLIFNKGFKFEGFLEKISYELEKNGFLVEIKAKQSKVVQQAMFKFLDILYNLGLSSFKDEKLSIRLEIDSNPPSGWQTEISLVNKDFTFTVTHLDIPSLYATKLHACFFRKYVKGRDFYDFLWYVGKKTLPNFELLNNAIEQTEERKLNISEKNLEEFLTQKIKKIDFEKITKDIERFLEDKTELKLMNKDLILKFISDAY